MPMMFLPCVLKAVHDIQACSDNPQIHPLIQLKLVDSLLPAFPPLAADILKILYISIYYQGIYTQTITHFVDG
jgi:hypothetical protein